MTSCLRLPGRSTGMPSDSAVFTPLYATLSHVIFESGLGNSCSQPLLAKRPSRIVGSGRKTTSKPGATGAIGADAPGATGAMGAAGAAGAAAAFVGAGAGVTRAPDAP